MSDNNVKPCAYNFWLQKLNITVDETIWQIPSKSTKETRLKELQWKILHNIYPTNILLHKMKIVDNNKCSYCIQEIDYLEHLFYSCPLVKSFWKRFEAYLRGIIGKHIPLGVHDVLFGLKPREMCDNESTTVANHLILIGKMCISIFKKTKTTTSMYIIFEQETKFRKVEKSYIEKDI